MKNRRKLYAALLLSALPGFGHTQTVNPTANALGFNVFAHTSLTFHDGDTHGPVATGGSLILNGATIVAMNDAGAYPFGSGNSNNYGLVVGGSITYLSGNVSYVNQGYFRLGNTAGTTLYDVDNNSFATNLQATSGAFNSNPRVQLQHLQSASSATASSGIDFDGAFTSFINISNVINNYGSNPNVSSHLNTITIPNSPNPHITLLDNKVNYINLTGSQLNDLNSVGSIIFDNEPTATRTLVFNIQASGSFTWTTPNFGGISEPDGSYILWNFYGNTSLTLSGGNSIYGTIFAPQSSVTKSGANNNNGQIIGEEVHISYGETHYYRFSSTIPNGDPLPLEGIALQGYAGIDHVLLSWATRNEKDVAFFTVEQSRDGDNFSQTSSTLSQGNGDHSYSLLIPVNQSGRFHFRVAAKDHDGSVRYSNTVSIDLKDANVSFTGNNPFTDEISLSLPALESYSFQLTDINGKVFRKMPVPVSGMISGLDDIPVGIYLLQVVNSFGEQVLMKKVVKE